MLKYAVRGLGAVIRFIRNDKGASMVEYGILVGLIAVVSIVIINSVGKTVSSNFSIVDQKLKAP